MKVAQFLEGKGWNVDISSYYLDDITNKPREIDIVARKRISMSERIFTPHEGDFDVFLFIECKHFSDEIAFWMHKNDYEESEKAIITEGNKPI